nr:immunoglobulin light chain junction region [Macaca mulatta]
CQRYTTSPFSF